MAELANCSRCNNVFVKSVRNICHNCYQAEEEAFQTVYDFLKKRKNRQATVLDIVEATEVEEALVVKFIREGRLQTSNFPKLSYPCENCNQPIITGKYCTECSESILSEFKRLDDLDEKQET